MRPPRPVGAAGAELSDRAGYLWWDDEPLIDVTEISLPGAHNRANAMAAACRLRTRGIERDAVAAGLRTFPGVAHRLELIATRNGVAFVNDSKATNVASTLVALRSYARRRPPHRRRTWQEPGLLPAGPGWSPSAAAPSTSSARRAGPRAGARCRPASRCTRRASWAPPPPPPRPRPARRHRPALTGVRQLRPVPGLRGPGRPLPRSSWGSSRVASATASPRRPSPAAPAGTGALAAAPAAAGSRRRWSTASS